MIVVGQPQWHVLAYRRACRSADHSATSHYVYRDGSRAATARPPKVISPVTKADNQIVSAAITRIREQLKPNQQGGYAASAVGQVLAQMGHDKATRARIVKQIPKLKEVGSGPEKRLIF